MRVHCYPWRHDFYESNTPMHESAYEHEAKRLLAMLMDIQSLDEIANEQKKKAKYYILYEDGYYQYRYHIDGWSERVRPFVIYPVTLETYQDTSMYDISNQYYSFPHTRQEKEAYDITIEVFNEYFNGDFNEILNELSDSIIKKVYTEKTKLLLNCLLPLTVLKKVMKNVEFITVHQYDFVTAAAFEQNNKNLVTSVSGTFMMKGGFDEVSYDQLMHLLAINANEVLKTHRSFFSVRPYIAIADIYDYIFMDGNPDIWTDFIQSLTNDINRKRREQGTLNVLYKELQTHEVSEHFERMFLLDVVTLQREWYSLLYFVSLLPKIDKKDLNFFAMLYGNAHYFPKWKFKFDFAPVEPMSIKRAFKDRDSNRPKIFFETYPDLFFRTIRELQTQTVNIISDGAEIKDISADIANSLSNFKQTFEEAKKAYDDASKFIPYDDIEALGNFELDGMDEELFGDDLADDAPLLQGLDTEPMRDASNDVNMDFEPMGDGEDDLMLDDDIMDEILHNQLLDL